MYEELKMMFTDMIPNNNLITPCTIAAQDHEDGDRNFIIFDILEIDVFF